MKGINRYKIVLSLFLLLLLQASCNTSISSIDDYKAWFNMPENGFVKSKIVNGFSFTVQHRPVDLMILNELKSFSNYDDKILDSLRDSYGNNKYFLLEISPEKDVTEGVNFYNLFSDYDSYSEAVNELAFKLNEQLSLIIGGDTLKPSLHIYEQVYELSSVQKFLVAFQTEDKEMANQMTFVYNDDLFRAGRLKFNFTNKPEDIPQLPVKIN